MTPPRMDAELVRCLLAEQFPQWALEPIRPVEPGGWDNRTFRVGSRLAVRLPTAAGYVPAVAKERQWLPVLAGQLPLAVPQQVGSGRPGCGYPWPWSVRLWLPGVTARVDSITDLSEFARMLARFLRALHAVETTGGPTAGEHSFGRGGPLRRYDFETRSLAHALSGLGDRGQVLAVWDAALDTEHQGRPVWVHGDLTGSNLLMQKGRLTAVIDWGTCAVGDPACDLAIAWTLLDPPARDVFAAGLGLPSPVWARARGWALWKALVTLSDSDTAATAQARFGWRLPVEELVQELLLHQC